MAVVLLLGGCSGTSGDKGGSSGNGGVANDSFKCRMKGSDASKDPECLKPPPPEDPKPLLSCDEKTNQLQKKDCEDENARRRIRNAELGGKVYEGELPARADRKVALTAFKKAVSMGVGPDDKIMLSLFMAALVESECNNLPYLGKKRNDHNSRGFLQQQPGGTWGSEADVENVPHATQRFVEVARKKIKSSGQTAGQLAQDVQVSKYPDRYDRREKDARQLIAWARSQR